MDVVAERDALAAERAALAAERAALALERESVSVERAGGLRRRERKEKDDESRHTIVPGVDKKIMRRGAGPFPLKGQLVKVSYIIRLTNGLSVDLNGAKFTATDDQPRLVQSFALGEQPLRVPSFFDQAVASMKVGEVCAIDCCRTHARSALVRETTGTIGIEITARWHAMYALRWQLAQVTSIGYYAFEKGKNDVPRDADVSLEIYLISFGDDEREPIRNSTLLLFFAAFLLLLYVVNGGQMPSTGLHRMLE
jgi:hypothetical protein